jgi:hypothetical protein
MLVTVVHVASSRAIATHPSSPKVEPVPRGKSAVAARAEVDRALMGCGSGIGGLWIGHRWVVDRALMEFRH